MTFDLDYKIEAENIRQALLKARKKLPKHHDCQHKILSWVDETSSVRFIDYDGHVFPKDAPKEYLVKLFEWDGNILIRDPFPLKQWSAGLKEDIGYLKSFLSVRPELNDSVRAAKLLSVPEGDIDICFHVRRGDFKHWQGGEHYLNDEYVRYIAQELSDTLNDLSVSFKVTFISDEKLDPSYFADPNMCHFSSSFEEDYVRLMHADIVVRRVSTFSQSASACGHQFLGKDNLDVWIGKSENLKHNLPLAKKKIVNFIKGRADGTIKGAQTAP